MTPGAERDVVAAVRAVARLDAHADIGPTDTVTIDGLSYSGAELRRSVACDIAHRIECHMGVGSWTATRALRRVSTATVRPFLVAWGASPFTVETHARGIASEVRSMAFVGAS